MSDPYFFDVGSGAATAAHDQAVAEALDAVRVADQLIVATIDREGRFEVTVSGGFQFVAYTERMLGRQSLRLLEAEIAAQEEE